MTTSFNIDNSTVAVAYRLFRKDKQKNPTTLFHGINKSKKIKFNKWMVADEKEVSNPGGSKKYTFLSGFHVCFSKQEVIDYLSKFKDIDDIVISRIFVKEYRKKPRSVSNVYLCKYMYLDIIDWEQSLKEKENG